MPTALLGGNPQRMLYASSEAETQALGIAERCALGERQASVQEGREGTTKRRLAYSLLNGTVGDCADTQHALWIHPLTGGHRNKAPDARPAFRACCCTSTTYNKSSLHCNYTRLKSLNTKKTQSTKSVRMESSSLPCCRTRLSVACTKT